MSMSFDYRWELALIAFFAVMLIPILCKHLLRMIPAFRGIQDLNRKEAEIRDSKSYYIKVQDRVKLPALITQVAIFVLIIPFVITSEPQAWWYIPFSVVVILMFYDFFYYLTHRFLFHDGGFGPGPLMWVHAIHHQQRNPCRRDASFLHPIEACIGLGLYGISIGVLGWLMGDFHVITIIITWVAFSEINQHNHDRMDIDRFPFRYLKKMSDMHHVHHARFIAGNFATITLFYDWLFGTYDVGEGWNKKANQQKSKDPGLEG